MKITKTQAMFLVDTLKALRDRKARIGKHHYRVTIYRNDIDKLINLFSEVEE